MSDGPTAENGEVRGPVDPVAFERLQQEVTKLRLQIGDEVRTGRLVVVDDAGIARARITAESGGDCRFVLLDEDGFERISLKSLDEVGAIEVAGRSRSGEPTRAAVVAHDPTDGDGCVVGLYLMDRGNEVAGFHVFEERQADVWTEPS
jgi:hypothetical protein